MNFFGTQQKTRRASYLILTVFVASLAAMALVIQITIGGLAWMVGASDHLFQQQTPIIVFTVFVWLSVLLGAVFCWMDISGGGAVVARRLGAFELRTDTRVSKEKELRRIVIEMAIASHCEQPEIFLLRAEHSINSFVVGSFDGDIALVVSEGALRKLDRDELQAVVAHEFGHIANKDVPTNQVSWSVFFFVP